MTIVDKANTPLSISTLIKAVEAGDLGLPEFQRSFIWKPWNVVELLRTVARVWPCGTFLLQEGPQPFQCKSIKGGPALKGAPSLLVLDGQQRLTALYSAFRERGAETYFVEIGKIIDADAVEDEHFQFLKSAKYFSRYPSLEAEAAAGVIRVATLADDESFFSWTGFLKATRQRNAIRVREKHLAGFKHYTIPALVLDKKLPLAAVAKIFETLNRTGVRLDTFDLMIAKLYPIGFRLKDEWEAAQETYEDTLKAYGVPGIEILKVIALREHLRQAARADDEPVTIKGVRESDVINLDPETVKRAWQSAVVGYVSALTFLREECGVISGDFVPAAAMILPLSVVLPMKQRRAFARELKRWFWTTSLLQTYSQGANTQCVRDAKELIEWNEQPRSAPESVRLFNGIDVDSLLDARRRNEMLTRALLAAIVVNGGIDWSSKTPFMDSDEPVVPHRIMAKDQLSDDDEGDLVVDFTPLTLSSHKGWKGRDLADLAKPAWEALEGHLMPRQAAVAGDWQTFRRQRAKQAADLLVRLAEGES